jgi:hypothetical protein
MATAKVTITLDGGDLQQIRSLVAARKAASVSGFVQHAVTMALHDVAGWGALLAQALEQTGGPLTQHGPAPPGSGSMNARYRRAALPE